MPGDPSQPPTSTAPPAGRSSSLRKNKPLQPLGGGFSSPFKAITDPNGNTYVSDQNNNAVKKMPQGCTSSGCVSTLGGGISHPGALALDGAGNIYVSDQNNNAVKKIPPGCASSACVTTLGG